ncbi:hypothetical protein K2173_005637 [Erythroxylum novogranatense]|uniref:Nucleotide-diphospho-sugar transferase domain-containing protein n=1 Tax=Erythroxylum novogranatense TaxID=1862640 RepID=A0AAV8SQB6_9ROSI|nr:hypothetical protein K2173_005637 [Erythroxylum novogranatense]
MCIWRNAYQEVTSSKPLFVAIYTTVLVVGIVFLSFFVFSAVYSNNNSSTSWLSSTPSITSHVDAPYLDRSLNYSQLSTFAPLMPTSKLPNRETKPIWDAPPRNSKIPPLKNFRLTKQLVKERVKDNVIIVTFGKDFILTWVKHLTDMGLSNLLVGTMDTKLLEALYWKGIPVFDMGSHMSTSDVGWGSATFHKMGREKVIMIDAILPFGYEVLIMQVLQESLREAMVFYDPPEYYDVPDETNKDDTGNCIIVKSYPGEQSWLSVQLCQGGSQDCHASDNISSGLLKFPKRSNEETFKTIFSAFKHIKVIQFSSMQDVFAGFTNTEREEKFRRHVKQYVAIWCCVASHTPGHVYYDMYWDEKPS